MKFFLLIITLFYNVNSFAQDYSSIILEESLKDVHFTIDSTENKPLTVNFDDGRVAVLRGGPGQMMSLSYEMVMDEMVCNERTYSKKDLPQNCKMNIQLQKEAFKLVWLQHPDSSKIGQELKTKSSHNVVFDNSQTYTNFDPEYRPTKTTKMKRPALNCEQFRLGDFTPNANDTVNILEVVGDFEVSNNELRHAENRTIEFAENIDLKFLTQQKAEFLNLPKQQNILAYGLFFIPNSATKLNLVLPNHSNEICQLGLKSKIGVSEVQRVAGILNTKVNNDIVMNSAELNLTLNDIDSNRTLYTKYLGKKKFPAWVGIAIRLELVGVSTRIVDGKQVQSLFSTEVE